MKIKRCAAIETRYPVHPVNKVSKVNTVQLKNTCHDRKKMASSLESVGNIWLGQVPQRMKKRYS